MFVDKIFEFCMPRLYRSSAAAIHILLVMSKIAIIGSGWKDDAAIAVVDRTALFTNKDKTDCIVEVNVLDNVYLAKQT